MAIDKIFDNASVDGIADNLFKSVSNSVSEVKAMQQRKAAENVQLVIQALKKIESDIQDKYDGVTTVIEKRVSSIKDGRDGRDGVDGKAGKDGRPGRDGATGLRGIDGVNGVNGVDGDDGVSVVDAHIDFDGSLIIGLSSGRAINVGEVVAPDLAEKIKVITNGGGTSQSVLDTLTSLQNQITAIGQALIFAGSWNASTNTPTLASSVGVISNFYIVSVAGSTNLNGITNWGVGDWAIYNGTVWQRLEGGAEGNFTNLSVSGTTTLSGLTASTALALDASKNVVSVTNTGTGSNVLATSPTLVTPALGTPSSGVVTNLTGTASININGTVGATTPAAGTFTSLSDSGNLTFTGTGNRITGDFSNGTVASRVAFQTSTVNSATTINAIPNGTGTSSQFIAHNAADPGNAGRAGFQATSSIAYFFSDISGTGTYVPMVFRTSGADKLTIAADTTGTYTFGGTAPRITGDFSNATNANRVSFQTSTVNGGTIVQAMPNGTGTFGLFRAVGSSDPDNASVLTMQALQGGTQLAIIRSDITGTGTYLPMTFYTGGSEAMRIAVAAGGIRAVGIGYTTLTGVGDNGLAVLGNVGIGTSSNLASSKLDVRGRVRVGSGNSSGDAELIFSNYASATTAWDVAVRQDVGGANNDLKFLRFDSSGVYQGIAMQIDSAAGNVGIGTSVNSVYDGVAQPRPLVVQSSSATTTQYNSTNAIVICNSDTTTNNASQLNFAAITGASTNQYTSAVISCIYGARTNTVYPSGILTFATSPVTQAPVERMRIDSSGNVLVTSAAGLGYGTGSGGTVTQATSKSTAVTLNKPTGQITMNNAALLGATAVVFRLNDSLIASVDTVIYAASGNGNYEITTHAIFAGAVDIRVTNATVGSLSEALVINFSILKGATS